MLGVFISLDWSELLDSTVPRLILDAASLLPGVDTTAATQNLRISVAATAVRHFYFFTDHDSETSNKGTP